MITAEGYRTNPDYGSGVLRRHIRLSGRQGEVCAELEDNYHAMRFHLAYAGNRITSIRAEFIRTPLNTCSGAGVPLMDFIGFPLEPDFRKLFADGRAKANCTHMFDLLWLSISHGARDVTFRTYEIEVPDCRDQRTEIVLSRDGRPFLNWLVDSNGAIHAPDYCKGQNILRGFTTWALRHLSSDDFEAAFVVQRAFFVSLARRVMFEPGPLSEEQKRANAGVCFGWGHSRLDSVIRTPTEIPAPPTRRVE